MWLLAGDLDTEPKVSCWKMYPHAKLTFYVNDIENYRSSLRYTDGR